MNIKRLVDGLPAPKRETTGSAGYDLRSAVGSLTIQPNERIAIETGFAWQIPEGMVGLIRPRSGLAFKQGIHVMAGVIDSDYRDEVKVILINLGSEPVTINSGDRIAQMVVTMHYAAELTEVGNLSGNDRCGGFGSTGLK